MINQVLARVAGKSSARPDSVPFVGRRKELAAIAAFCKDIWEGEELAVCWLQGEAGIGKSALVSQAETWLKVSDRIIITIRLYPYAVNSVASLLAETLNATPSVARLLTGSVHHSLPSILTALRRLVRLRPLTLIIEDLHLLEGETCVEFHALLQGLCNESLPVLCVSRIATGEAYTGILPYLRKSIEIPPLKQNEVEELTSAPLLQRLHVDGTNLYEASRGYPLILQGLVREMYSLSIADQEFGKSKQAGLWLLNNRADLSIKRLAEAFMSGLTEQEKEMTQRLAILGERFSAQAAALLIQDAPVLIDRLLQQGIIVRSTSFSLPLYGPHDSAIPYRFNHTLLFEELLRKAAIDEESIIHLIEQRPPLYSLTLFQQLEGASPSSIQPERLQEVIRTIVQEAGVQELRVAFDRKIATLLCQYAEQLYQRRREEFSSEQQRMLLLELLVAEVRLLRQRFVTQGQIDKLEELTRLTESPQSEGMALYRSLCLSNRLHHYFGNEREIVNALQEAEELIERFPSLLSTKEFMYVIAYLASQCATVDPQAGLLRIQAIFDKIMAVADPALQTSSLSFVGTQILYSTTTMATTPQELERAIRFSHDLHSFLAAHCNERDALVLESIRAYVFFMAGCIPEAMEIFHHYRDSIQYSRDIALMYVRRTLIVAQSAIGIPIPQLEARFLEHLTLVKEMEGLNENDSSDSLPRSYWILAIEAMTQGYLRGNIHWGEQLALRIADNKSNGLRTTLPMNKAAAYSDKNGLASYTTDPRFGPLVQAAIEHVEDLTDAISTIRSFLVQGVMHLPSLLELQTVLDLVQMAQIENGLQDGSNRLQEINDEIAAAIRQAIDWCVKKQMPGYAIPFLRFGRAYISQKEVGTLSAKVERLAEQLPEKLNLYDLVRKEEADGRNSLSVIGTIAGTAPSAMPEKQLLRFQGARVRRMVALIAAHQIMQRPLSIAEFRHIATGMDQDAEKTAAYTRTLLWRIRSVLGSESIIADGDAPPRFNPDHIRVDLIEASDYLDHCAKAVSEARPRQAREAAMNALSIVGEGPIYPTLYDEFFEAARLDFEIRLWNSVRSTATLLRREGDLEEAERLLRAALHAMPGDEELLEELAEILGLLGRNAEAVALRQGTERRTVVSG